MKQKRLEAICSFLTNKDHLIDIGCDHGYVCIKMAKENAPKIIAADIHEKALESAKKNIKKEGFQKKITCILSDGLEKIDTTDYDTIVIAGMGTSTMIHILDLTEKLNPIKKIILQSNNELDVLRKFMNEIDYALEKEKVVFEKGHYYTIMKWIKKKQKLSKKELCFGLFQKENLNYYKFLLEKDCQIQKNIPFLKWKKRTKINWRIKTLKSYIKKSS